MSKEFKYIIKCECCGRQYSHYSTEPNYGTFERNILSNFNRGSEFLECDECGMITAQRVVAYEPRTKVTVEEQNDKPKTVLGRIPHIDNMNGNYYIWTSEPNHTYLYLGKDTGTWSILWDKKYWGSRKEAQDFINSLAD
jgi:hypothetical protein